MRSIPRLLVSLAFFLLAARVSATELRHFEDATLRSVYFIDDKEGWVVGDEGVILHTFDGGKRWDRQPTGVRALLRSVQFVTPFVGWAVGREELPYGMGSVGVALFTNDGGLEWKKQLPNMLPGFNQVRFVDAKTGFMLGDGNDQFPFGVFRTTDSGQSWEPVAGPRATSWLTADFYDANTGILAGAWSRLGTLGKEKRLGAGMFGSVFSLAQDKTAFAEHSDWLSGRDITSMTILSKKAIAVGQGGLVLSSTSGGKAWGFVETKLPTKVLANLDFHSVHAVKDKVWIAGRPGSALLHSSDGGATWSFQKTRQALPLHGVFFFDEKLGWAVGDAGTVLATSDGGKSWNIQRQAGKRAAAMTIHSLNRNAPVDTIAHLGAADGNLTTSLCLTAPDSATIAWGGAPDSRRYSAAIRLAGGVTGETLWHFPMPQHLEGCDKKTILAHWNQLHNKQAEEELLRQLVLTLRIWRPSVIVADHSESKNGLSSLLGDAVEEAVRRAADPKSFPDQINEIGLDAWKVSRVYGLDDVTSREPKRPEGYTQTNSAPVQRLEASVRDYAATAHALLTDRYVPLPRQRMNDLRAGSGSSAHWLAGLDQRVGESKRDIKLDAKTDVKLMQALTERRSVVERAENLDDPTLTLKLLPPALDKLPDEQAAAAAFAIAGQYAERGQWYLAQEVYLYMVDRFPAHPLSIHAYRWLIRLNTSGEARRRHDLKHFAVAEPIGLAHKKGDPLIEEKIVKAGHVVPADTQGILSRSDVREWNKGSMELTKRLSGYGPVYGFDPPTQFCLQKARRNLGEATAAHEWMTKFTKFVPGGAWHEAARAEQWVTNRSDTPRHLGRVRYTEVRPFLEGKFDDPCWKDLKPMVLENAVGDTTKAYATEAMFAFDQEFLYVALKCKHPVGQSVAPVKPRPRDADVNAFDRVSILLDLDRDYATYHHLEVDQRGCVRDSCWGDLNWNPRWFVAVHTTDDCWQIEAAIPLAELTSERITQQTVWAFNVVRIMPGRGVQSVSQPADVRPRPEGMSLLQFQPGTTKPMPMPAAP